jgi:anti-sigma-K factor RskA
MTRIILSSVLALALGARAAAPVALPRVEDTARPSTFAVTVEPAAGSAAPTGDMVLAGAVS